MFSYVMLVLIVLFVFAIFNSGLIEKIYSINFLSANGTLASKPF